MADPKPTPKPSRPTEVREPSPTRPPDKPTPDHPSEPMEVADEDETKGE